MQPLYPHDNQCDDCIFLGIHNGCDLYFCKQPNASHPYPVVVAINPNKFKTVGETYRGTAEQSKNDPFFSEVLKLANKAGFSLQDQ